jgi:hypothetical protein
VGRKDSLFYSDLQGLPVTTIKDWYCNNIANNPNGDPYNLPNPARGFTFWDTLTPPDFWASETTRLRTIEKVSGSLFTSNANGNLVNARDTVQKRMSQAFAEESSGTVYFFTRSTTIVSQFGRDTGESVPKIGVARFSDVKLGIVHSCTHGTKSYIE